MSASRTPSTPDDGLADFLPDAYLVTDADGVVREANRAFAGLIGHARTYALGKPLAAYVHPPAREAFLARLARAGAGGPAQAFETHLRGHRALPFVEVRVWLGPVRDADGAPVGLRWLLRDVTEENATAARLAQMEAAHAQELRTRTMELEAACRMLQAQLAAREHDTPTVQIPSLAPATRAARAEGAVG